MSLIDAKGLSIKLGQQVVLSGVDFHVDPGEIVTIVGPNGSGKSTLLHAIIGAVRPSAGTLKVRKGLNIGYVPQKLHVDETLPLTVRRFLSLPTHVDDQTASAALDRVGAQGLQSRQMTELSGGQFQRVLLARALTGHPDILILDEATQGLDQPGAARFYEMVEALRTEIGCAIIMVSHELHVVMAASDRVVCLNGHVCCQGAPELVASAPEYRALFGTGTHGALALYRHDHNHSHSNDHPNAHVDEHDHEAMP